MYTGRNLRNPQTQYGIGGNQLLCQRTFQSVLPSMQTASTLPNNQPTIKMSIAILCYTGIHPESTLLIIIITKYN